MTKNHALILGNTGFLGKALEAYFHNAGVSTLGYGSKQLNILNRKHTTNLTRKISEDTTLIFTIQIPYTSKENPSITLQKNVQGLLNCIDACIMSGSLKKFVFISSTSVYGDHTYSGTISEKTECSPHSWYAHQKYIQEKIVEVLTQKNIPILIIRPTILYGPNDPHTTYGPANFIKSWFHKKSIILFGKGDDIRDFLYINDAVAILAKLSLNPKATGTYNLASGKSYSFKEVAEYVGEGKNTGMIQYTKRKFPKTIHQYDVRKLQKVLKKYRYTSIKNGVKMAKQKTIWQK